MQAFALPFLFVAILAVVLLGRVDAVRHRREEREKPPAPSPDQAGR